MEGSVKMINVRIRNELRIDHPRRIELTREFKDFQELVTWLFSITMSFSITESTPNGPLVYSTDAKRRLVNLV